MRSPVAVLGAVAALALAGCSSLPIGQPASVRSLDYLGDDLASALIAFDLPASLEPLVGGSALTFDLTPPTGAARHVRAVLQQADADDLAGTLPPPADGHTYYLFGFAEADQKAIRDAQAFARTLPAGQGDLRVLLSPALCRNGAVKPDAVRVSVRVALPSAPAIAPVIADQPLSVVSGGAPVPECPGHSN